MRAQPEADGPRGGASHHEEVEVRPVPDLQAGRDPEFSAFMVSAQADLLRLAWLLLGDPHRAEELAQQALERTYGAWARARRDPMAYTRRVLINLRTDAWRRRRREVLVAPDRLPEAAVEADGRIGDRDELGALLAVLTPRQRRVVVLRYLLDLSDEQVAADLGVTAGTVKSTASRALARLRGVLGDRAELGQGDRGEGHERTE